MIRLANYSDLDNIKQVTKACAKEMISNGIYQWNEHYPSKDILEKDIAKKELYVTEINDSIVGCIMFSKYKDDLYNQIDWLTPDSENLYVHRLAVHPDFQKKGLGKSLMDFAENYAKDNSYVSVRLDTFSENKRNLKFYESRGYQRLDGIYFPKQSEFPFYCYELIL